MNTIKGAFWIKQTKNGKDYLSGNVEIDGTKHYVNLFHNDKATGNQPVWKTIDDKPKDPASETKYPTAEEIKGDLPF